MKYQLPNKTTVLEPISLGPNVSITLPNSIGDYPLLIQAKNNNLDPLHWALKYKQILNSFLPVYGAILLRGFDINGAENFNELFRNISGEAMEYSNRTSPREQVFSNVYTSTSHPKDQIIHMHTENSYSKHFNRIIAFYCLLPPQTQGETPIADERKLLEFLSDETKKKFRERKVRYIRNIIPGIGLDWRSIYQTSHKEEVNRKLEDDHVNYTWIDDERLRLEWVLPAFHDHPITGEQMWFNHMYFGHKSLVDKDLLEYFGEDNLPFSTTFGDGTQIDDGIINEFKEFYKENTILFTWEKDDFLLLDNMIFSHGRNSYEGNRTILTAMGEPHIFNKSN